MLTTWLKTINGGYMHIKIRQFISINDELRLQLTVHRPSSPHDCPATLSSRYCKLLKLFLSNFIPSFPSFIS